MAFNNRFNDPARAYVNTRRRVSQMASAPTAEQSRVKFENALMEDLKKFEENLQSAQDFIQNSFEMVHESLTNLHAQAAELRSSIVALTGETDQPPVEQRPDVAKVASPDKRPQTDVIDLADKSPENGKKRRKGEPGKNVDSRDTYPNSTNDKTGPSPEKIVQLETLPSTSREASCSNGRSVEEEENIDTQAVKIALRRLKGGVLSDKDLLSFVRICQLTDDPMQAAGQFSVDLQGLKRQLVIFSFHMTMVHEEIVEGGGQVSAKDLSILDTVERMTDAVKKELHSRQRLNTN